MEQSLTGKALILVGLAPLGGLAIDFLGADIFPTTQLFVWYGITIFLFGVGIHREQIQFDQDAGWYYEGLSLLMAFMVIVTLGLVFVLSVAIA